MAAPRMKPPVKKKKTPVKKTKVGTVKSPEETRKSISRKQVGTSRPARDVKPGDLRSQTLANDNTPRPAKDLNKGGLRAKFLQDASKGSGVAKGLIKKIPVVGAAAGFIIDSSPAGTGSTVPGQAQKAVQKKMKREIRQGPKLAVTGVKEGIRGSTTYLSSKAGSGRPEYPSSNKGKKKIPMKPAPGTNYSGQSSTYSGYGNFNPSKIMTNAANTAATTTAAAGSKGGSKADKAGGSVTNVSKAKVGKQTRYQRNETAMEQKRSSNRPKKSIFSLFRKG